MEFKSRQMPKFTKPFKPDHSKAALVTQSLEFNFKTDMRLGKAVTTLTDCNNTFTEGTAQVASLRRSLHTPRNMNSPRPRSGMPAIAGSAGGPSMVSKGASGAGSPRLMT